MKTTLAALGVIAAGLAGAAPAPVFRDVAPESGLRFHHFTGSSGEYFMPEIIGAGGALFDYDGDGDLDVLLVQGAMLDERKTPGEAHFPPAPASRRAHGCSATTSTAAHAGRRGSASPTSRKRPASASPVTGWAWPWATTTTTATPTCT